MADRRIGDIKEDNKTIITSLYPTAYTVQKQDGNYEISFKDNYGEEVKQLLKSDDLPKLRKKLEKIIEENNPFGTKDWHRIYVEHENKSKNKTITYGIHIKPLVEAIDKADGKEPGKNLPPSVPSKPPNAPVTPPQTGRRSDTDEFIQSLLEPNGDRKKAVAILEKMENKANKEWEKALGTKNNLARQANALKRLPQSREVAVGRKIVDDQLAIVTARINILWDSQRIFQNATSILKDTGTDKKDEKISAILEETIKFGSQEKSVRELLESKNPAVRKATVDYIINSFGGESGKTYRENSRTNLIKLLQKNPRLGMNTEAGGTEEVDHNHITPPKEFPNSKSVPSKNPSRLA